MGNGIEFDWGDENRKHLATHRIKTSEAEEALNNDPLDLDADVISGEHRYRSVGITNGGRLLSLAWTVRDNKVRVITAFPASVSDRRAFLERDR